jgi:hypothetical protein
MIDAANVFETVLALSSIYMGGNYRAFITTNPLLATKLFVGTVLGR